MEEALREAALYYHRQGKPGKISVEPTKKIANQRDLALAYLLGVDAVFDDFVYDCGIVFVYTSLEKQGVGFSL